uniref:Uncharacterized protein n=1 Tax=Rangifer tarandus platyrhynchus TaxID=3082113 RepID=A0ACB0DYR5_RANTA|nr:unnamed protein product [Rangifer tarandus platyrhynchus]
MASQPGKLKGQAILQKMRVATGVSCVSSLPRAESGSPPLHSGGLHAERLSSIQGDHTASGLTGCSPPFAICLLNLCPRLLRPHLELLQLERVELSLGPYTLHEAAVKGVTGASGKCAEGGLEVGPGRWGTRAPCVARGRGCCGPWRWEDGAALPSGLARQSAGRQAEPLSSEKCTPMIDELLIELTSPASSLDTQAEQAFTPAPPLASPRARGTRSPAGWVINSPFVFRKVFQVGRNTLPSAAPPGERVERASHGSGRAGLCAARPPHRSGRAAAIVPRGGGRLSDPGSTPALSPVCLQVRAWGASLPEPKARNEAGPSPPAGVGRLAAFVQPPRRGARGKPRSQWRRCSRIPRPSSARQRGASKQPPRGRGELPTEPARRSREEASVWSGGVLPLQTCPFPLQVLHGRRSGLGLGRHCRARAPLPPPFLCLPETREREAGASADRAAIVTFPRGAGTQPAAHPRRWRGRRRLRVRLERRPRRLRLGRCWPRDREAADRARAREWGVTELPRRPRPPPPPPKPKR